MIRPLRVVLVPAAAVLVLLAGCATESSELAQQARAGDNKSYISGDGEIVRYAPEDRLDPLALSGPTITGEQWSLEEQRGTVVVLNKWGSWCPPCVEETPELVAAWEEIQAMDGAVTMVGLNFRESPETGAAFAARSGMTYPSLADEDGILPLELQGRAQATPTTLVIDREGRIAATVAGPLTRATLMGLVEDVLEDGDAGSDG
jgi:peroxiredoxin